MRPIVFLLLFFLDFFLSSLLLFYLISFLKLPQVEISAETAEGYINILTGGGDGNKGQDGANGASGASNVPKV